MVALMGGGPGDREGGTQPITSYQPHLQHSRHKRNRKSALNGTENVINNERGRGVQLKRESEMRNISLKLLTLINFCE